MVTINKNGKLLMTIFFLIVTLGSENILAENSRSGMCEIEVFCIETIPVDGQFTTYATPVYVTNEDGRNQLIIKCSDSEAEMKKALEDPGNLLNCCMTISRTAIVDDNLKSQLRCNSLGK